MTPIRVHVADMGDGARRVVLACSCVKVGRVITRWESLEETIEQLRADHRRQAPLCRHPWPGGRGPSKSSQPETHPDPRPSLGALEGLRRAK